jgi:hypothetical protein
MSDSSSTSWWKAFSTSSRAAVPAPSSGPRALNVARELIRRHIESSTTRCSRGLDRNFDLEALRELGHRFALAREKLALLEDAKAA